MSSPSRVAWMLALLGILLAVTGMALTIGADAPATPRGGAGPIGQAIVFGILGAVIVSRQPRNAIGWIFGAVGLLAGLRMAALGYAKVWLSEGIGPDRLGETAAVYHASSWFIEFAVPTTFLLLLFPDGRLPGWRWRMVAGCSAVGLLGAFLLSVLRPGRVDGFADVENPYGLDLGAIDVIGFSFFAMLGIGIGGSALSLILRFRGAAHAQRQQIKLLAVAGAVAAVCTLFSYEVVGERASGVITSLSVMSLPAAAAVAMLRYHLYDIDVVINRALVYGSLTAILAGVYLGSVLVLQLALRTFTEGSSLAIAASTLATAALVRPAGARIQSIIDRRFYRHKYDAARTLEAFGARLHDEIDLEALTTELRTVVAETMQPAHLSVWVRITGDTR